uniref:Dynein heavy chain linker domain-containing protein n=1 Tax=Guillardia theta TaxID=55529 RepID=A0A7S4P4P5_GUITH|mmetsp:Transcript_43016/g.135899  ORF Transcript_43016/g.135899 Transcript_43016/m.135899 type:complete len:984 (+) Transcript_43016:112-3063(+)
MENRYFDQEVEDADFSKLEGINISSGLLLSTKHTANPIKDVLHCKKVLTPQRKPSKSVHSSKPESAKLKPKKIHQALLPDELKSDQPKHQGEDGSIFNGDTKHETSKILSAHAHDQTNLHAHGHVDDGKEIELENKNEDHEQMGDEEKANEQSVLYCLPDNKNPLVVLQRLRQNPDSTEFVYLKSFQIDEITPLNPYHLEIVPHNQIPKSDFFTLSSFGVTHFVNGKPEFTELEQWKREHFLFNAILKIPVFKRYRIWKSYKVWRDSVRYGKMRSSAKALTKNLFFLNPTFREALLRIRDMCMDLQKVKLYSFQKDTLYTIVHFFEAQQAQRNVVLNHLEEFWLQAIDVAKSSCIATLDSLEEGLFGANSVKTQGQQQNEQEKGDKISPRAENFRYTVMASKRVVQRRLYYFLRLCDYVIFNTLHTMVVESTSELLAQIEPNVKDQLEDSQKKRKAVFLTEISLILGDLTFVPGAADFENELDSIVGGFVDTVSGSNSVRLLNNEDLEQYTELFDSETETSESSTVSEIVTNDEEYRKLLARIKVAVANAFDACNDYVSIFEPYQTMVVENEQLDEEELRQKAEEGEFVLQNFKEKFDLYHSQADNIRNLPDEMDCGIMQVNSKKLKTLLSPSPASCLEKLEDILPQLTVAKQRRLLDEVNIANNNLSRKPTNVASFVSVLDFVSQCNERKDEIDAEFKELQDHYSLMDENSVEVNSMDRAAFQMLVPEYNQMKNMLDIFESTQDDEMARWSTQLEEDIKLFHHEIEKLRQISQDPQLLEDVEFIDPVLHVCEELKEQANAIEKTAKQNQSFQTIFGQQVVRYPVLEEVVADDSYRVEAQQAHKASNHLRLPSYHTFVSGLRDISSHFSLRKQSPKRQEETRRRKKARRRQEGSIHSSGSYGETIALSAMRTLRPEVHQTTSNHDCPHLGDDRFMRLCTEQTFSWKLYRSAAGFLTKSGEVKSVVAFYYDPTARSVIVRQMWS